MTQRAINYLKMVFKVIFGMNAEKAVWEDDVEIKTAFTGIEDGYTEIHAKYVSILGVDTTGYTDAKNNLFDSIMQKTFKVVTKLAAFAKVKKDFVLLQLVDISYTTLSRGPEPEAIARCLAIMDKATVLLPQLTNFKVTEPQLTVIRQEIKDYKDFVGGRSASGSGVTVNSVEADKIISSLRTQLDTLDSLIVGLVEDDSFIGRYHQWRKIDDDGTGKTLPNPPAK